MRDEEIFAILYSMETICELYSRQDLERLEKRYGQARWSAALLAAAALAVCVLLCVLTDRDNAERMEKAVVTVSVLVGWILIYLHNNVILALRYELSHARMLMEEERTVLEGVIEVSQERMHIRGSIRFYPLCLNDRETTRRSKVIASRGKLLRAENGRKLRLYVVNGYAAAFERL